MPDNWWTLWWVWMAGAMVLGILEVLVPGYIFLGFAMGAVVMAGVVLIGLPSVTLPWSLVAFTALSLLAFLLVRRALGRQRGDVKIWDRDINDN